MSISDKKNFKSSFIQWEKRHLRISNDIHVINAVVNFIFSNIDHISRNNSFLKIGLQEILINAIEHGNLNISYEEKKELLEKGDYEKELEKRAGSHEFKDKCVDIKIFSNPDYLRITVDDMGNGFDLSKIPDPENPENFFKEGGKGIFMALNAFDKVEYNDAGNSVILIKYSDSAVKGDMKIDEKENIKDLDKLKYVNRMKEEFDLELNLAAEFQKSFLPKKEILDRYSGIKSEYFYIPLHKVSGDFIDINELDNGVYGFFIADISGHGVAAALISTMLKVFFSLYAKDILSPQLLFEMLNQEFFYYLNLGEYFTSFYGIYFEKQKKFVFTNANHPSPVLLKKKTREIIPLNTEGFFVGIFKDTIFEEKEVILEKGDRILFFTDGAVEAKHPKLGEFGKDRLIELFHGESKNSISKLIHVIKDSIHTFTDGKFNDDIALAIIEIQ